MEPKDIAIDYIENTLDNKVLSLFPFGSRVYGTNRKDSDYDFIAIVDGHGIKRECDIMCKDTDTRINITVYNLSDFNKGLEDHDISLLECIFLPDHMVVLNNAKYTFELKLHKLRSFISAKASNSWVKCKKKLTVEKEYDSYIVGIKSLFHAFRILEFGKQIAAQGKIISYSCYNKMYFDLVMYYDWNWWELEKIYKKKFNNLCTEFRKLAPKMKKEKTC